MKNTFLLIICLHVTVNHVQSQNYVAGRQQSANQNDERNNSSLTCDTIFSFSSNAPWIGGLAFDGSCLWLSSNVVPYIYKYNLSGTKLDSMLIPAVNANYYSGDLEMAGNTLLFSRENDGILYKIDPVSKTILSQFNLPHFGHNDPNDWGLAYDGTYLWHSAYNPGVNINSVIYKLDFNNGTVLDSFIIGGVIILPIKFIDGILCAISISNDVMYKINTGTKTCTDSVFWCLNYSLGFVKANNTLYALNSQPIDRVYEFNTITGVKESSVVSADITFENPVSDQLIIHFNEAPEHSILSITDLQGRVLIKENVESSILKIPVTSLSDGIYLLSVISGNSIIVKKMVKAN